MHEKQKIDFVAHLSKDLVDAFGTDQNTKDYQKLGIDAMAEVLKQCVDRRQAPIVRIQTLAYRYNLDRVILFPCTVNGCDMWFLRMYGGAVSMFCAELGIPLIQGDSLRVNPIYLEMMEQQHGIVLYDRNTQ